LHADWLKAEIEKQLADETQKVRDQYDPTALTLETVKLTPVKENIQVKHSGILWMPKVCEAERLSRDSMFALRAWRFSFGA
jgi:hypothetical protein